MDNASLSVHASRLFVGPYDPELRIRPSTVFASALSVYGLPVRKSVAYDLLIRLDDVEAVRRVRVSASCSFTQLHLIIQAAYEWQNYHLYKFGFYQAGKSSYFDRPELELAPFAYDYEVDYKVEEIGTQRLSDYLPEWRCCEYEYDFGDGWTHIVELAGIIEDCDEELPKLLSASGVAPPEDAGGPGGFEDFLAIMQDAEHSRHEEMLRWARAQGWKPLDYERVERRVRYALWW